MYIVYKHVSPSKKVYIGITSQSPEKRWMNGRGYSNNNYFTKAIKKYGWDKFKHEILFEGLTKCEAEQKEIELIAEYKSNQRKYGYNISAGGNCTVKGLHWKYTSEQCKHRSGKNHPMYGVHLTDEQRKHLSNLNSGENHPQYGTHRSEEIKKKISEKQKGKVIPKEQREKISNALRGNIPGNCRKVTCVETGETFYSMTQAQKSKGISCMWKALRDGTKTAGGYHWKYA
jgi:group I intron endonuclease